MLALPVLAMAALASSAAVDRVDDLEEVVVHASAFRTSPLESVQPASVLSGDALQSQATASLGETLSSLPGVSSSWFGPIASRPIIRGVGGSRLHILEDGLPLGDASSLSDDHAVTLEASNATQIEVLRGPAALLYGVTAASGAVNVVTALLPENPLEPGLRVEVGGRYDSALSERSVNQRTAYATDSSITQAWLSKSLTGDVITPLGAVRNTASDTWSGSLAASRFLERDDLGIAVGRLDRTYGIPGTEAAYIGMREDRLNLRGEHRFDDEWFDRLAVRYAADRYRHTEFESAATPGTSYGNDQQALRISLERLRPSGLSTIFGLQASDENFDARGQEAFVPSSRTRTATTFGTIGFTRNSLTVEWGARLDHQQIRALEGQGQSARSDNSASVAAGVLLRASENTSWTFNVTSVERPPQATEFFAQGPHGALSRVEIGDSDLQPEQGTTVDVGWRYREGAFEAQADAFHNHYRQYIFLTPTGNNDPDTGFPIYEYRQKGATFTGAEMSFAYTTRLSSGTTLRLQTNADVVRGKTAGGEPLPAIPPARAMVSAMLRTGVWHLETEIARTFTQRRVAPTEVYTTGFTMVDVVAGRDFKVSGCALNVYLRASNLLNQTARVHASALKDFLPLPSRSVRIGFSLSLR